MSCDSDAQTAASVLPLLAEDIRISRERIDGRTISASTVTSERLQVIDEELTHQRVEIERIPIGREVDATPPVRHEDDVIIMPVMEEVVVVQRRLILKEEIRLRRVPVTEKYRETVSLRQQTVSITQTGPSPPSKEQDK